MKLSHIRSETVFAYKTEGADKVIADAKRVDAANDRVTGGENAVAAETQRTTGYWLSAKCAVDKLQASLDCEYHAMEQLKATATLDRAYSQGELKLARHASLMRMAQAQHDAASASTRRLGTANDNFAASLAAGATRIAHRWSDTPALEAAHAAAA